jgi:Flp pilus assembly protein TadD
VDLVANDVKNLPAPPEMDALPVAFPVGQLKEAARLLEQALRAGCHDPHAAYMLGVCYKKLGRTGEARAAFQKIPEPDANVFLQLGLLSFAEKAYAQAEQEFARAWEMAPECYEAAYDLLLARMSLGWAEAGAAMVPKVAELAPSPQERRFLFILQALLAYLPHKPQAGRNDDGPNGDRDHEALLSSISPAEEQRLLQMLAGLGQFETSYPLLRKLAALRPNSPSAQEAYLEVVLLEAKEAVDRCHWEQAQALLAPFGRAASEAASGKGPIPTHLALLNLLGVCSCMLHDFEMGIWYFTAALKKLPNDPLLHQNLALAHELHGRLDLADTHWNRYFDLLDRRVVTPPQPNYLDALTFEGLLRLADNYSKKEKWTSALTYLQRAHRLRPNDADTLERLFHMYTQVQRPDEARRALKRLREVRPNDPQFDLYELEVRDLRTVEDVDRLLGDLRRTLGRYSNDMRVEERAATLAAGVIPRMERMCDQLTNQLNKILDQMRRLPSYQINWPAVREVMRDLLDEFLRLRRVTNKCALLVSSEEQRRIIRDLNDYIDRKIALCHQVDV